MKNNQDEKLPVTIEGIKVKDKEGNNILVSFSLRTDNLSDEARQSLIEQINNKKYISVEHAAPENKLLNPDNKCSQLFKDSHFDNICLGEGADGLEYIFQIQKEFQLKWKERGWDIAQFPIRTPIISVEEMQKRCDIIKDNWTNLCVEYGEMMNRLPYKYWKKYGDEQGNINLSQEEFLEILFEYDDMFKFFMNIGLALGIDGRMMFNLFFSKYQENLDRQERGY